jgi:hypothetical protein
MDVIGEHEVVRPVNDLLIRLVRRLGAEWRVADEALKHDRAERPPVALVAVALLEENLRCNVVRRADGRVSLGKGGDHFSLRCHTLLSKGRTSFLRFAFHVAIWSLLDMVRWIAFTMTLFRAAAREAVGETAPLAESKRRW